jgi:plastocyanin
MKRLATAVLALAFVAACGGGEPATPQAGSTPTPEHTQIASIDAIVRGRLTVTGKDVAIALRDNYFSPNLITAVGGVTLTVALTSNGTILHNFSVAEQKIDRDVEAGSSTSLTLTVPASRQLVFFCKYHRDESGMIGAIDVS